MPFRTVAVLTLAWLLSACGTSQPTSDQSIQTAIAQTQVVVSSQPSPTPAAIWKDKLNGAWVETTESGNKVEWIIDLDAGELAAPGVTDDKGQIQFDREEGKTVYATVGGGETPRSDSFRFINDDMVVWTPGDIKPKTLERKR